MPYCPKCGKQINQTAKFCKACGFEIDSEELEKAQTSETKAQPTINETPSSISTTKKSSGISVLGLSSLITGLIFGILTVISFFLPWCVLSCYTNTDPPSNYWSIILSGLNAVQFGSYSACGGGTHDLYIGAWLVIVSSAIMVVFVLLAIVTYKKQGIQRGFVRIAQLGAICALGSSIWSCCEILLRDPMMLINRYGIVLAIVCCSIGLLALLIADLGIWRYQRSARRLGESSKDS